METNEYFRRLSGYVFPYLWPYDDTYRLTCDMTAPSHIVTVLVDIRCCSGKNKTIGKLIITFGPVFGSGCAYFRPNLPNFLRVVWQYFFWHKSHFTPGFEVWETLFWHGKSPWQYAKSENWHYFIFSRALVKRSKLPKNLFKMVKLDLNSPGSSAEEKKNGDEKWRPHQWPLRDQGMVQTGVRVSMQGALGHGRNIIPPVLLRGAHSTFKRLTTQTVLFQEFCFVAWYTAVYCLFFFVFESS